MIIQTYSTAEITECNFTQNQASDDGGAIYVMRRGKVQVIRSKFEGNSAEDSGGSVVVHTSYINISYCNFENESVVFGYGGSVCALDIGNVSIEHSSFRRCSAAFGGSLSAMSESIMSIEHSLISESLSNRTAGAVFVNHESTLTSTNISILNCSSASGGGISCRKSTINLDIGMLSNNRALLSYGGGFMLEKCGAIINNFTFISNTAVQHGGGLYTESTPIELHNIKSYQNIAGQMGGFMLITKSAVKGQNLEFSENYASATDSNIAIAENSVGDFKHLHSKRREFNDSLCPIVVQRSSNMTVTSLYHTNSNSEADDSVRNNKTLDLDLHVCDDSTSFVGGMLTSGMCEASYISVISQALTRETQVGEKVPRD